LENASRKFERVAIGSEDSEEANIFDDESRRFNECQPETLSFVSGARIQSRLYDPDRREFPLSLQRHPNFLR